MADLATTVPAPKSQGVAGHVDARFETLLKLDQASCLLLETKHIQDVKQIRDLVKAAELYAREQHLGRDVIRKARAVVFEAERRIGELLAESERAVGGWPYQKRTGADSVPVQTLTDLGLDKKTSSRAQQLFALPLDVFNNVREGRTTLDKVLAEAKRAATAKALRDHVSGLQCILPFAFDLHECSCTDLFASGVKPAAVITEPPRSRERLSDFSDLARACVAVPLVAVMVDTHFLPDVLQRLCEHLKYRSARALSYDSCKLILLFCDDTDVFDSAMGRSRLAKWEGGWWERYFVQTLSGPGELVCDPFLKTGTALAALEYGRRFVGSGVDVKVVEKTRQEIESASAWRRARAQLVEVSRPGDKSSVIQDVWEVDEAPGPLPEVPR